MGNAVFPKPLSKRDKICWLVTIAITIALCIFVPVNDVWTISIKKFIVITIFAILLFCFELMDNYIPSLLLPVLYILTGTTTAAVAFSTWTSDLPWVVIGSLLLVNVVEKTGLLTRVAYWTIIRCGGSYRGLLIGIMLAGIVLNFMLPGSMMVPLIALAYSLCIALNLGKSKAAAGVMIVASLAAGLPNFFILGPMFFGIPLSVAKATIPTIRLTYMQFLFHNWIWVFFCFALVFLVLKMFKSDVDFRGKEFFKEKYSELGKMTLEEKKAAGVVIALIIYLATMGIHGLPMAWGFVIAACLMFFPGINLGTSNDIQKINMSVVLFIASCMSIGVVATSLGIGEIIVKILVPHLNAVGTIGLFAIVIVIAYLLNFVMTPLALLAILAAPLAQLAINMGMNPLPVLYCLSTASDQVLLPYEYVMYLFAYSFGIITIKDFVKFFSAKTVLYIVFLFVIAMPYWTLIGIL